MKNLITKILLIAGITLSGLSCSGKREAPNTPENPNGNNPQTPPAEVVVDYILQTPSAEKNVDAVDLSGSSASDYLAVLSLQGLANRDRARIYTYSDRDRHILELYQQAGYINSVNTIASFEELLTKYKEVLQGAVVYDPDKNFTVNLATNIAGVENRLILAPDKIEMFKRITGISDILDLRTLDFKSRKETFQWYITNVFPKQSQKIIALAKDLVFMYDIFRDYLVEFKVPVFWLPGPYDRDFDSAYEQEVRAWLRQLPPNIPVLGFSIGADNDGHPTGYEEMDGVTLTGLYGKFTLVNTWVGNYSFHSGIRPANNVYRQEEPRKKTFRQYDPQKKYVALIMIESGDAPCYFLYDGLFPRQWSQSERGEVAISYGLSPSLRMLTPGVLRYLYDTQTANDYFFCSISGVGYCYPFRGYADNTSSPAQSRADYFEMTGKNMQLLDMDMLGIYTHPDSKWKVSDRDIADKYIFPMPGLKSIISGMHRVGYTAADGNETKGSVTVHHTLTFWPTATNYAWNDTGQDAEAVRFMENEIKTYGAGGNFIQAMFYSWMYGPRRLKQLKELMEPQGYEFVTLDEFDYLYRSVN
jgi:hypothetical protein